MKPYVIIVDEEVASIIAEFSSTQIFSFTGKCHARVDCIEKFLDEPPDMIIVFGDVKKSAVDCDPWRGFYESGHWFKLKCSNNEYFGQREYWVSVSEPPKLDQPDDKGRNRDNRPPGANAKKGEAPRGEARAARLHKPRKTSFTRKLFISYKIYKNAIEGLDASALWSLLARSVQEMRIGGDRLLSLAQKWADFAAEYLRRVNAALRRTSALFETQRPVGDLPVTAGAALQPRLIGQTFGMHMLIYTFVSEEVIDWSADLFGRLPNQEGERAIA